MKLQTKLLCFIFIGVFVSCGTKQKTADIAQLYNRSAQYHGVERNPVVVIPGILGSKLIEKDSGQVIWGAFGGDYANPQTAEGARSIALPLESAADAYPRDSIVSDGALDRIKVDILGLPIQLSAYFELLSTLGAGGYRDESLAALNVVDYGDNHFTCFQFDYDWRYDISISAKLLHEFLEEKRAYVQREYAKRFGVTNADIRFDIVAHSMGGLVSRYFLRYGSQPLPKDGSLPELTWEGAEYINKLVLVGTPNAGAIEVFIELVQGAKFSPIHPSYDASILGSMPSLYGLLPRPRHRHIVEVNSSETLDIYDAELWQRYSWGLLNPSQDQVLQKLLPNADSQTERQTIAKTALSGMLQRTKQIHQALDLEARPPNGTEIYLVAGDALATDAKLLVNQNDGSISVVESQAGDGTVLRSSALLDERIGNTWSPHLDSPISWTSVLFMFQDHLGMTKEAHFADNLLYLLLEAPPTQ